MFILDVNNVNSENLSEIPISPTFGHHIILLLLRYHD